MTKRGGRKRKTVKREASGRPQRQPVASIEQDAMLPVLEYRRRVFGLSVANLKDQKAATLLGRLCIQGAVSEAQWQAGEDWLKLVNARYAAANAPRGFKTSGNAALAIDEDAEARRYWAIKAQFDAANAAIEDHAPVSERIARMQAMSLIVVQEQDQPKMHGILRTALNGLVRHFKMQTIGA